MAKKAKPLTPAMQDCLKRFGGDEYKMPFGRDIRTCEALESRGLLEGDLRIRSQTHTAQGILTNLSRAYRRPQKPPSNAAFVVTGATMATKGR